MFFLCVVILLNALIRLKKSNTTFCLRPKKNVHKSRTNFFIVKIKGEREI